MDQAGAGFHKPGQQQRLLFPVEVGHADYEEEQGQGYTWRTMSHFTNLNKKA